MALIFVPKDLYSLAEGWYIHVKKEERKHILSSDNNENFNILIGYPAAALQAVIALSVFTAFIESEKYPSWLRWVAIAFTIVSAFLVAIQTKGDFARAAEQHRMAASRFKVIIQDFEAALLDLREAMGKNDDNLLNSIKERLAKLREHYEQVEKESPQRFLPRIEKRVDQEYSKFEIVRDFIPETSHT